MIVRIAGINHESVTDGPGLRTVIFFQGCHHACPGCHNPQTWDAAGGEEVALNDLIRCFRITPLLSGFTFSGGEPFLQAETAAYIAEYVKSKGLNLWVYTGYTWEQLMTRLIEPGFQDLIHLADVIVEGPYQQELRDLSLPYRGSSNQRILLAKASLRQKRVVLWGKS